MISADHSSLAERSDHWLQAKPGTEADVLRAIAAIAASAPENSAAVVDDSWFSDCDIDAIVEEAGIDRALLEDCAALFADQAAGDKAAAIWYALDENATADDATALSRAANNLAISFGVVGEPGGGVLALRNAANMQGSIDVGCHPQLLPGHQMASDSSARSIVASTLSRTVRSANVSQNGSDVEIELPTAIGIGVSDLPAAIRAGDIRALYISAQSHHQGSVKDDYFSSGGKGYFKDQPSQIWSRRFDDDLLEALEELDVLIVEDCFPSELTSLADIILPTAMYLEQDGTFTNVDRTVQRLRYVVRAPGDSQPTRIHLAEIARRLGFHLAVDNPASIFDSIADMVADYGALSYPRLERSGVQWPATQFGSTDSIPLVPGKRLDADQVRIVAD